VSRPLRAFARAAVVILLCAFAPSARADVTDTYEVRQQASFDIYNGQTRLGTEKFRIYATHDTLITASTVRLDGAGPDSRLPFEKRTTFLQRSYDSYPLVFQIVEQTRRDTTQTVALNCVFRDTVATIFREEKGRGVGSSVALPPGRLYLLEPGIYLQVQLLLADFLAGSQQTRKQPVLIPSLETVVDLWLTKGPIEAVVVRGKKHDAQRVEFTDKLTNLVGWMDTSGRLLKLEAPGQGLRVERGPEIGAKNATAAPAPAPKKKATAKRSG